MFRPRHTAIANREEEYGDRQLKIQVVAAIRTRLPPKRHLVTPAARFKCRSLLFGRRRTSSRPARKLIRRRPCRPPISRPVNRSRDARGQGRKHLAITTQSQQSGGVSSNARERVFFSNETTQGGIISSRIGGDQENDLLHVRLPLRHRRASQGWAGAVHPGQPGSPRQSRRAVRKGFGRDAAPGIAGQTDFAAQANRAQGKRRIQADILG